MARSINRLSAKQVTSAGPGRHADGGNLYLVVDRPKASDPGDKPSRRWVFRYKHEGREFDMGIGPAASIPLAKAREVAAGYRAILADGGNPLETRRAELAANRTATFGEEARALWTSKEGGWRSDRYTDSWLRSLEVFAAPIWDMPVDQVATTDVQACIQPIWLTKSHTAGKVRGRIERVLDAARAKGLIDANRANPARWRGHLDQLLPKRQKLTHGHHKALPYAEMAGFMASLRQREATAARLLEFTILTCVRSGESRLAVWSEVNLAQRIWVVPASKTKAGRENRVALSSQAVAVLERMLPHKSAADGYVFPGHKHGKPLSVLAMQMLLRRMDLDVTVHGFRSTFRDWCEQFTNTPREIPEAVLSHQVGSEAERAYRRGDAIDKRRALLQQWADACDGQRADNVVPIARSTG